MPFFQVGDEVSHHPKHSGLIERYGEAGLAAVGLWTMAGSLSQAKLSDGLVSSADLLRMALSSARAKKLSGLLVEAGLWHSSDHDCDKCPNVPPGSYIFHDWYDIGYDPGAKVKQTRARRAELRKPEVVDAVWLRDGEQCRYCGRKVVRSDRKSAHRPTLDHVIPGIARGVGNLVVACLPCNQKKAQRTPEQAGMTLRPAPTGESTAESNRSDFDPNTDPDVVRALRTGTRSGPRLDLVPGQREDGSPAGAAPDPGTPGRFGSAYYGHRGRSPTVEVEICPTHNLELPCRKCTTDRYDQEATTT